MHYLHQRRREHKQQPLTAAVFSVSAPPEIRLDFRTGPAGSPAACEERLNAIGW